MTTTEIEVPYLVVGAGPVGLTAALLLAERGHRCLVIERRTGPQTHPAAHVVNARTLEILRQAGVDMDAVLALAQPPDDAGHVNFVTRLDGELIGRLPFERQGDECLALSPTPLRNISQHRLEPVLADDVLARPGTDLRYGVEWRSSTQDDDGVSSVAVVVGSDERLEIRSSHVIAADGAGSRIRASLGIEMLGPPRLQSFVAVHLAADLRAVIAGRPGVLHFVMDPAADGTFVGHDVDREWVFMTSFDPDRETVDDYPPERAHALVQAAIGEAEVDIEVLGVGSWHMSAQVAERMRGGRIFLVGDAAHRFPPTGGLGLNTGVADAHGLVWKLDAVARGWAGPRLLDTYETERLPVAGHNCAQSATNALQLASLFQALDLVDSPTTAAMDAALADPDRRPAIDDAVAEQATHFDMLGLQLGYTYAEGALVRDGDGPDSPTDPSRFDPDAAVGSRLPHGWTSDGRSTLDLVRPGELTALSAGRHDDWAASLVDVGAPVRHVRLGDDVKVDADWLDTCGLAGGAALLVRPDQHVAWRGDAPTRLDEPIARIVAGVI